MSAIKMHTPQTYSRLFRPWDSVKTKSENCENKSEKEINIKQIPVNNDFYGATCSSSSSLNSIPIYDGITSPNYFVEHYPDSMYATTSPYNAYFPSGLSSSTMIGMDPLTFTLVEQEYARVLAEDVQIKAINARKQRPKKFKCPHCDVAFSNNGQLKGHIRIHTGERPFKCDLESCGKTFTRNEELTRHKRIHTGIRPFPCTICGKKFGRRDHLKKHMKTHMPQEKQLGPAIFVPMYPYLYGC